MEYYLSRRYGYHPKKMKKHLTILLILILALALRLIGAQSRPIWYDEAFSILFAEKGPAAILSGTLTADANSSAAEEHPPTYYFILWAWTEVFGTSLISVRILSIIFSLGTIVCIYFIAHHLFNEQTARTAAIFVSILPFQIHYGVEVRMYILLTFWLMLATLAYLKRWWIVFSLTAALAQYTHNLAAIYLIPLALTPLIQRDWKTLRSLTLAGIGSIILYAPWLIQLPSQISKVTSNFWIEKPGVEKIFTLLLIYISNLPLPDWMLLPGLMFSAIVIVFALFQTLRAQKENIGNPKIGLWLAYLSFIPPLLLWSVSQLFPLYIERAFLPSHAIFCIWLAWSFYETSLPTFIQKSLFAITIMGASIGIYQHKTYDGFPYAPFQELDMSLRSRIEPGDKIIHASKATRLPMAYFDPTLPQEYIADPPGSNIDTLSTNTQKVLGLIATSDVSIASNDAQRIWFVVLQHHIDAYKNLGYQDHPYLIQLKDTYKLLSIESWDTVRVYILVKKSK